MNAQGSGNVTLQRADYKIGWICALSTELAAATVMLDEIYGSPSDFIWDPKHDHNPYTFGRIGCHHIVLAVLPAGVYGTNNAALTTKMMGIAFPNLYFVLMVGIGGGVPSAAHDIRLGDVVVSKPVPGHPGVLQYDFGKTGPDGEVRATGVLSKPPPELLGAIATMETKYIMDGGSLTSVVDDALSRRSNMRRSFSHPGLEKDVLYRWDYTHVPGEHCTHCSQTMVEVRSPRETTEPSIHYGLIGSGNQVIKDGRTRERFRERHGILCFEMEAAGIMDTHPCLVIRGVCDYADSHKNKSWQGYAAITAAAYAKDLLLSMGIQAMPRGPAPEQRLALPSSSAGPMWGENALSSPRCTSGLARPLRKAPLPAVRPNREPISPQLREEYGKRILQAAREGKMPLVKIFLEKGGDPSTRDREWNVTALHFTAQAGHHGGTHLLLKAGADPNVPARFTRNTPLFEAASHGHTLVIRSLLQYKADVMRYGRMKRTPLHAAAAGGHFECVRVLVDNGADPDCEDGDGYTPLDLAEREGHLEIAECLREAQGFF
ncbi:nucleoside phosphorylase domain-containing protein [Aspergillus coremiiformis]|uniref:Nucleoside phosphorylase domain-containing protein n=1 Tax=Aspergillus coremiiformis TaxID=138285 RepID=A0A5N6ZEF9_9EURO|nr:nucleoside phosphorylase domain-containing protein [Aspergillus coremiiformis]